MMPDTRTARSTINSGPWRGGVGTDQDYAPSPTRPASTTTIYSLEGANGTYSDFNNIEDIYHENALQENTRYSVLYVHYNEASEVDVWSFSVSTGFPAWPGLGYYEPHDERIADPKAIGWQLPGSPIYLIESACAANGAQDLYDEWTTWNDETETDGYWTYWLWLHTHYRPMTSGFLHVTMTDANSSGGYGAGTTCVIGKPTNLIVVPPSTPPSGGGSSDADQVYMGDVYTSGIVGGVSHATVNGTFDIPLPALTNIPGYGDCIVTGLALSDIRGAYDLGSPMPGEFAVRQAQVRAYIEAKVTAPRNQWRLLYVGARNPSPLRQSGRTDGLIGAPRQGSAALASQIRQGRSLVR